MYINDIQNVCPNVDNLSTDDTDVFVHGKSEDVVDVATCLMLISLHWASISQTCYSVFGHVSTFMAYSRSYVDAERIYERRLMLDAYARLI